MIFRRLLPTPGEQEGESAFGALELDARAPAARPWVAANMIATVDGRAAWRGRSGALGGAADRELFQRLRGQVDAILAGTGTMAAERYGRLIEDPEARAARERGGLAPDPLAVLITRSGHVPQEIPLLADAAQPVLLYAPEGTPEPAGAAALTLTELPPGELTLARMLADLRERHGVRSLLCEGGPHMLSGLIGEGVLDELFLTISPHLAGGGEEPSPTVGAALAELAPLRIESLYEHDAFLFARYAIERGTDD